jgi:hypothetical protein
MNIVSKQYRFDQHPIEHIVLPPTLTLSDELQVEECDIEEITLPVPDWDHDVVPIIH